jgi:hypothetical protein
MGVAIPRVAAADDGRIDVAQSVAAMCQPITGVDCSAKPTDVMCASQTALQCATVWVQPDVIALGALHAPPRAFSKRLNPLAAPNTSELCTIVMNISKNKEVVGALRQESPWRTGYAALGRACNLPLQSVEAICQADATCAQKHPPADTALQICASAEARSLSTLSQACGHLRLSAGSAAAIAPIVDGLGDFLKVRAKEELLQFALSTLGRDLCTKHEGTAPVQIYELLPLSCKTMFPEAPKDAAGTPTGDPTGKPDLDAVTSGKLQKALETDLNGIPAVLIKKLPLANIQDGESQRKVLLVLAQHLQALLKDPKKYTTFLADVEKDVAAKIGGNKLTACKPAAVGAAGAMQDLSSACVSALFLTFAAKAQEQIVASDRVTDVKDVAEEWFTRSESHFCATYANPATPNCLVQGRVWEAIDRVQASTIEFVERLRSAATQLETHRRTGKSLAVLAEDAAVIGDTFATFIGSLGAEAEKVGKAGTANELAEARRAFTLASAALRVGATALARDYTSLAKQARVMLEDEWLAGKVPPKARKAALFFLDLSAVKDRKEARELIEDVAAPLGSYQRKYDSEFHLAINSYVGIFGAYRGRMKASDEGLSDSDKQGFDALPLAAPVGLDFTIVGGQSVHFGLGILVIDPLATDPSNAKGQVLNGVLAPGVMARLGIAGSPIVLTLGGRVQPLLESAVDDCGTMGTDRCWRGQWSLLAGIGVDVPIIYLE